MNEKQTALSERLQPVIELRIPNFEQHYLLSPALAYGFKPKACQAWYRKIVDQILSAAGESYFPVLRMFDGEYAFAVGAALDRLPLSKLSPRQIAQRLRRRLVGYTHQSGSQEYGFEGYTAPELAIARVRFAECVRTIAQKGILALGLHDRPICEQYMPDIFDWFDVNSIVLNEQNYSHFYFIYALMHGPDRKRLLLGQRVLVVTGLTEQKRQGIEAGLHLEGVADVQFLPLSHNKAMFDVLDLSTIKGQVDVVLVGAGVGSANILVQLEPLQTVCIDVGFALSTLANPDLRWNRPVCVPDDEFDLSRLK